MIDHVMRCAERTGTGMMLWLHEFYMVMEPQYGAYLYQAIEFKVGSSLPPEELIGGCDKQGEERGLGPWGGLRAGAACS